MPTTATTISVGSIRVGIRAATVDAPDPYRGRKLFVDYCGQTMPIVIPIPVRSSIGPRSSSRCWASNYTFAEATRSQQLEDWVMSHKRAFEFFGGVPQLVVPDCLKSAVSVARNTDPISIPPTRCWPLIWHSDHARQAAQAER